MVLISTTLIPMMLVYIAQQKKHHNELKEQGDKMIADKVRLKFINENTRNLLHKLKDQLKDQEKR